MVKNKGILLRESEDKINIIKKLANREGKTISEFIRNRVFIEPIVLEKLNEILSEVKNAKLTN